MPRTWAARIWTAGLWAVVACLALLIVLTLRGRDGKVAGETTVPAVDSANAKNAADDSAAAFSKRIAPFVAQYCGDCHSGATPEAKLDLTKYADAAAVVRDRRIWRKVFFRLQAGEMPPQDQPQPKADEIATVTHWIDAQLAQPVPFDEQDPGRMTIRRLNRAEYNNTVRDLMGIDFEPADDFPADDVGEGFDNIGAVLSLSPLLMEKYLAAADQCVDRALTVLPQSPPPTEANRGSHLEIGGKLEKIHKGVAWISSGEMFLDWKAPSDGDYEIRVRAFGEPKEDRRVRMAIKIDGHELQHYDVKNATIGSAEMYGHRAKMSAGWRKIAVAMLDPQNSDETKTEEHSDTRSKSKPDSHSTSHPHSSKVSLLAIESLEIEGPLKTGSTLPESYRKVVICQPAGDSSTSDSASSRSASSRSASSRSASSDNSGASKTNADKRDGHPKQPDSKAMAAERADCARRVIRHFADRAFRRPATDDEVDRLMAMWRKSDSGGPFDRSLTAPLEAVLVSPQFLFRVEADPDTNPTKPHRISDYELASRMSYFLWSSMPDDELFALARRDELHRPATLEAQVRRMIADPKSEALVDNFAAQWLQYRRLASMTPDKSLFPQFDEELRADMRKETEFYFAHVMRDDRSVVDFLDSSYTFLNNRLAEFYGIGNVAGGDFRQVNVEGKHRGGLLTQSSILLVTSNPGRTSPVKRGKWILENLLGAAPPPPPANVPPLKDDQRVELHGTLRQRMEQHRSNAICASCHKTMDPLGFGLENFDALGRWRTTDGNLPIDASGTLPSGRSFDGVEGLKKILVARRDQFCRCLVEKMLTYALGRALEDYDAAAVDQIAHDAAANDYRFSSVAIGIVRSAPFEMRRGKEEK